MRHMLLATIISGLFLSSLSFGYSDGSGTAADPYQINSVADWQTLMSSSLDWDKYFILTRDIDLADILVTPVGNSSTNFTGSLDGNDHTISNIVINTPSADYVGLFGFVGNGQIQNLDVTNADIQGNSYVGGLVGYNASSITSCSVSGTVRGVSNRVGGLIGENYSPVDSCRSTAAVSGTESVGGLVGLNWATITSCQADGMVNGVNYVGGLIGENYYTITSCRATGPLSGVNCIGGLIGLAGSSIVNLCSASGTVEATGNSAGGLIGFNSGCVDYCFATGGVSGENNVGGLAGYNWYDYYGYYIATITNCYATGDVNGSNMIGGLVGKNEGVQTSYYPDELTFEPSEIIQCYSTGSVNGNDTIGGLVGSNNMGGLIKFSYAAGDVNGNNEVGGLIGRNNLGCTILSCYARGDTTGVSYVGGLAGISEGYSNLSDFENPIYCYAYINESYSTGIVNGNTSVGGLIGSRSITEIGSCFWDTQTSGRTSSAGGTGKTTVQMKTLSTFTSAGWDFATVWDICEGTNYPRLQWQIPEAEWVCPDGVNVEDMTYFAGQWLENDCNSSNGYCGGTDMNTSGKVDLADFAVLAENWLIGDPTLDFWVDGHIGNALEFEGVNDYVDVTGYQGITGTASRTCCAWIKTTTAQQSNIISWGGGTNGQGWLFRVDANGALALGVRGGYVATSATVNDGQWHYVAAVLDSDGSPSVDEVVLYIDGVLQSTTASSTQSIDTLASQNVMLGAFMNSGVATGFYVGLLDEVCTYGRALDAGELNPEVSIPTEGLIAHWAMDEATGTVAHDSVSSYDGTLVNY